MSKFRLTGVIGHRHILNSGSSTSAIETLWSVIEVREWNGINRITYFYAKVGTRTLVLMLGVIVRGTGVQHAGVIRVVVREAMGIVVSSDMCTSTTRLEEGSYIFVCFSLLVAPNKYIVVVRDLEEEIWR